MFQEFQVIFHFGEILKFNGDVHAHGWFGNR